jgi:pyridoxal phosphate enzyme (YggS family)
LTELSTKSQLPTTKRLYPPACTLDDFVRNLAAVRMQIANACRRVGRHLDEVRLLAVSKSVDEGRIRLAHAAGCREFAENKVQEAGRKWKTMVDLPDLRWSMIGHLQTNKVKVVARFANEVQTLDSLRVAEALDRRLLAEGLLLDVFVQVNTSGEASKYGLPPGETSAFVRDLSPFQSLHVRGLMTLALLSSESVRVRRRFAMLRSLRDQLRQDGPAGVSMDELSMGMSGRLRDGH